MTHSLTDPDPPHATLALLGDRLARRVADSARHARSLLTVRERDRRPEPIGPGLAQTLLCEPRPGPAEADGTTRRLRLIDLAPGAHGAIDLLADTMSEWLVVVGAVDLDGEPLATLDFQARPAGVERIGIASRDGARLMLRESRPRRGGLPRARTARHAQAVWHAGDAGNEGVERRLLWHDGDPRGEGSFLLRVAPGSTAAPHRHRQAEDCLLLRGDLHLEDVLLFAGDYQCAPAGGVHRSMTSDNGALVFLHGDTEVDFIDAATAHAAAAGSA